MARAPWSPPKIADYEKLGVFYLGRPYDLDTKTPQPGLILYDSKDLVTHAVAVGMTGSGKTGLCISLIEEAAIDGIPTIAIDPKGDLGHAFAVRGLPTSILIDAQGRVVGRVEGAAEWDSAKIMAILKPLLESGPDDEDGVKGVIKASGR